MDEACEKRIVDIDLLSQRLLLKAGEYYPELMPITLLLEEKGRQFQESIVYVYSLQGRYGNRRVVAKVFKKNRETAQAQYNAMKILWPRFLEGSREIVIPRPLDFFPDIQTVVMEWVPGINLRKLANKVSNPFTFSQERYDLPEYIRLSGQWLRQFHEVGNQGKRGALDVVEKFQELKEELNRCQQYGLEKNICRQIMLFVEQEFEKILTDEAEISYIHGDFKLDNVLATSHSIAIVDLSISFENLIYHDIASFINSIILLPLFAIPFFYPKWWLADLSKSFLNGYWGNQVNYSQRILGVLSLMGLLSKYIYCMEHHSNWVFQRLWIKPFFESRIHSIIALQ